MSHTNQRQATKRLSSTLNVQENKKRKTIKFKIRAPLIRSVLKSGEVLVMGAGDVGQLGLGRGVLVKSRPALVFFDFEIIDVCAGGMHTVCLTDDGRVITFGCNDEGALGRDTTDREDSEFNPAEVHFLEEVTQISAGDSHTAVLLKNGRVFAWGSFRDSHGSMGLTMNGNERFPHEMLPGETVVKIASGADHLVMLTNYGCVFTCGCAEQGQLGRISERMSSRDSSRSGMDRFLIPSPIITKKSLKLVFDNIWAGTYCTFAKVHAKNEIYVFGLNNFNQIGIKSTIAQYLPVLSEELSKKNWKQICGAPHHTILLDEMGKVYTIGRKEYGRLGLGKDCEDATEIQQVLALDDKFCFSIASGTVTSFAITVEGDLWGWGMGNTGQLGTGVDDDCFVPTLIKSKQLKERKVQRVSSGGQHTVILGISSLYKDMSPEV